MLAALLVSIAWLAVTDKPQNSAMEEYCDEYEWYLKWLDGACTEEKAGLMERGVIMTLHLALSRLCTVVRKSTSI